MRHRRPPAPDEDPFPSLSDADLPEEKASLILLARAQEGDREALQELLHRYRDRLRRIVRIRLAGSPLRRLHDSMDLVQSTFLAAWPKLGELKPRSAASLLHWLSIIATNQIRDAYNRETADRRDVRRATPLDDALDGPLQASSASDGDPGRAAQDAELREMLDAEVTALPEDQRRAVILRDYCGESWAAVARELDRGQGAARQLHQRAWIRLRRRLRPALEDERGTS